MISQGSDNSGNISQWGDLLSDIRLQRLLIVQRDGNQGSALSNAAGQLGFEVTICSTTSEARNLIDGTCFDSIIIDIKPYGDGLNNFLKWIFSLGKEKPYVMLAVEQEGTDNIVDLIEGGVDDFFFIDSGDVELIARLQVMEARIRHRRTDLEDIAKIKRDRNRYESLFL